MIRKLTTIGTGSGLARHDRRGPCHLVQIDDFFMLMDCGEGSAGYLRKIQHLLDIKVIILTHLHPDHTSGLAIFIQSSILEGRSSELTIYIPASGIDGLVDYLKLCYLSKDYTGEKGFPISILPIVEIIIEEREFSIKTWETNHFSNKNSITGFPERKSFGVIVNSKNGKLVYTGDVATLGNFKSQIDQKTTLLSECMHIGYDELISFAKTKDIKQLILTHSSEKEVEKITSDCIQLINIALAEDGDVFSW